jgi:histidinol-phosphate aminotransferase
MSGINNLARDSVKAITPYASARRSMSGGSVWLNANENALATDYHLHGAYNRYPECQPPALIGAYANYAGVDTTQVLVSRGADEGIELLIRSFCEPYQDRVVICPPTYGMYAISAQSNQVECSVVPLRADFTLDVAAIKATEQTKLVFICSPNNPTGDLIPREQIVEVLEFFKESALVVLDEAYIEFAPVATTIDLLATYPNLVILRTLSKAFALAGLRCGFTIAAANIINALKQMIAPYPLAAPVAEIAVQALSQQGRQRMLQSVNIINELRDDFMAFARTLSAFKQVYASNANYVLLQVHDAAAWVNAIAADGILVRNQSSQLGLSEVIRVSIGNPDEMQLLKTSIQRYAGTL